MNLKKVFNREKKTYVLEKGTQIDKFFHCVENVSFPYQGFTRRESYLLGEDLKVKATNRNKATRKIEKLLNKMFDVERDYSSEGFYEDVLVYERELIHETC